MTHEEFLRVNEGDTVLIPKGTPVFCGIICEDITKIVQRKKYKRKWCNLF